MITLPPKFAQFEQSHPAGDSYSLAFTQTGFDFSAYTVQALLLDSKGVTVETLTTTVSGASSDTITISATPTQMQKPAGVYALVCTIAKTGERVTILSGKLTIKKTPLW